MGEVTNAVCTTLITLGLSLRITSAKFESFKEIGGDGINRWYQVVWSKAANGCLRGKVTQEPILRPGPAPSWLTE